MKNRKRILRNLIFVFLITMVIVAIFKLLPETKAEESNVRTLKVTYKPGEGSGSEIVEYQQIYDKQTKGEYDYTDNKIVFHRNGDGVISYNGGTIDYVVGGETRTYDKVLTGWKLKSVTKNGTKLTTFVEPEHQNYANPDDAQKDIDTVYAQEGWYTVPNGVTEIEVEAVYGRAIYVRSPYDEMYYDEYHIFYYGKNSDGTTTLNGGTAIEKSSDDNYGTSSDDAVATLKRAYDLMTGDDNLTVYDTVFLLCGDLYEVSYHNMSSDSIIGTADTYKKYKTEYLGYNTNINKPVTISSFENNNFKFYLQAVSYDILLASALRIDNLQILSINRNLLSEIHGTSVTKKTYPISRCFKIMQAQPLEITETVKTGEQQNIWYKNSKNIKANGGRWSLYWYYGVSSNIANNGNYLKIGGNARIDNISLFEASGNSECKVTNPAPIVITGGKIENIYGTSKKFGGSVKGNVYIYVHNGKITNLFGAGNGSVYSNADENGDININIYKGEIGSIYGAGKIYSSNVNGDVNINIHNAKITGDIYGGGKGGSINGSVNFKIKDSSVLGNIYGGGEGLTDKFEFNIIELSLDYNNGWDYAVSCFNNVANNKNTVKWDEASKGFPKYDINGKQIVVLKYHFCAYDTNYRYNLFEVQRNYSLTLSEVKNNVKLDIENCEIEKNVYGGGSIALVEGNVGVSIKNTHVKGNIYGGGDGEKIPKTVPLYKPIENYTEIHVSGTDPMTKIGDFVWTNDEDILTYFRRIYDGQNQVIYNDDNTTTAFNTLGESAQSVIQKYGNKQLVYSEDCQRLGEISGNVTLNIENSTVLGTSNVCGGGNAGRVIGNIEVNIDGISGCSFLYGGGYQGDVNGLATTTVNSGNIGSLYGGGYSGSVGSTVVTINKGTFDEIFGGGNLGVVGSSGNLGTTNVTVGKVDNVESNSVVVNGLVYGGGRGKITNTETQTNNEITVYGNSNVKIQGINTQVENYGSTKLGLVSGNIDVTFEDYWTGNATSPYKRMNGIDKATNVNFVRSYVLLENRAVGGALEGIKSIGNLSIPVGSGLKISAEGNISGNFAGRRRVVFR